MALKEVSLFGEIDKVKIAIERIKTFQPLEGFYKLPFSGGKDSLVCYQLAKMAGIKFVAIKAPTPDPPELIYYIRENYKVIYNNPGEAIMEGDYLENRVYQEKYKKFSSRTRNKAFVGKSKNIFNLIANRKIPPTRQARYCCSDLKENVGDVGDTLILGVRAAESAGRSKRGVTSFWMGKTCINPIIDWTDDEVWEFIRAYNLPYCKLYDEGFKRLGCVGCPLSSNMVKELEAYPKYRDNYVRAFDRMLLNLEDKSKCTWENGEDVYRWWIGEVEKEKQLEGQIKMCEMM